MSKVEEITVIQSLTVGNKTFNLKSNGRLYAIGNEYVTSTVDSTKVLLDKTNEVELDLCVKKIGLSSNSNMIYLVDTRDFSYDIICHDSQLTLFTSNNICNKAVNLLIKFFMFIVEMGKKLISWTIDMFKTLFNILYWIIANLIELANSEIEQMHE